MPRGLMGQVQKVLFVMLTCLARTQDMCAAYCRGTNATRSWTMTEMLLDHHPLLP